jgi:hypothetical protein
MIRLKDLSTQTDILKIIKDTQALPYIVNLIKGRSGSWGGDII